MPNLPQHFKITGMPIAKEQAIVRCDHARFTILTPRLYRLEYSQSNCFVDAPSQIVWNRCLPVPVFSIKRQSGWLRIETESLILTYFEGGEFTPETISIHIKGNGNVWQYGDIDSENLGGTARTLDQVSGETKLEPGLVSRSGWALLDDSKSLLFTDDGWLEPRSGSELDLYFFGYGDDYQACLTDYRKIAGQVPLIPRWALGNWWSRYWAYSQAELTGVINEFQEHRVPLSVAVIDMDWHITSVPVTSHKIKGWTGYTWNPELFPDPTAFIAGLHDQGLRITLNLHPADGIYPHEAQYDQFAHRLKIRPSSGEPIPFDIADRVFASAYFELLHHPEEQRGVDFWWIDWQQESTSNLPGLDPLWWLNHLHALDISRDGITRSFILSRWGGMGSHRYPIGFSGDAVVNWGSLAFQPAFTASAANVGYGWWSHDIGGHGGGIEEPELYTRWVQFGIFSPILRLHSSKNSFSERRPWGYDAEIERVTSLALCLRHAIIPYLYTMAWLDHSKGLTLVRPMYHEYPENENAYHYPQQYLFGTELLAAPFTSPADNDTKLAKQSVWLPEGDWYNFFTGEHVLGGKVHLLFGRLSDIPVFARAGAIVPMAVETGWSNTNNPESLQIHFFPGNDRYFDLYEDDGITNAYQNGSYTITRIEQLFSDQEWNIIIHPTKGEFCLIPRERSYTLHLHGAIPHLQITAFIQGRRISPDIQYDHFTETLIFKRIKLRCDESLQVLATSGNSKLISHRDRRGEKIIDMLRAFYLPALLKRSIARELPGLLDNVDLLVKYSPPLTENQMHAVLEVIKDGAAN